MIELKLTFKVLGSGYLILLPTDELPEPYNAIQYGMIDKQVDGIYYWVPDKKGFVGSAFPAWLLRQIADEIDRLNEEGKGEIPREELLRIYYNKKRIEKERLLDELNESARLNRAKAVAQLKLLFDVEGQKPYSMEQLEATKISPDCNYKGCDHKFADSNGCLQCGWIRG